jgi:hypothetical protein
VSNRSEPKLAEPLGHVLIFQSLHSGRACAFPCDAAGQVDMDALSDAAREHYLYARAVVGREYAAPAVIDTATHADRTTSTR